MGKIEKVAVIGGGAAGFFAALSAARHHPKARIHLYEKSSKVLAKVRISGGGRCNVTHAYKDINTLIDAYPRGGKSLRSIFHQFSPTDTVNWFETKGIRLKTEKDGRIFPSTDSSQTIIDCLAREHQKYKIEHRMNTGVSQLHLKDAKWNLSYDKGKIAQYDRVIISTGGSPKIEGLDWLAKLGHQIIPPVPSLFTFNMPNEKITSLMGVVVEQVQLQLEGSTIKTQGPLLITHWGMSGPAVLKASSFGARELAEKNYHFNVRIRWVEWNETDLFDFFQQTRYTYPLKKIANLNPLKIPNRLWQFFLLKANINLERNWNEIGHKKLRKLIQNLLYDSYQVAGKTTFKEEFVTCGGVSRKDIDLTTMESKITKGLYFAGEVLDIDAITGGFNFQAAWSGGYVAGKLQ